MSLSYTEKLLAIMSQLRDPENGCPWDLEQDFSTIAPYTLEEAYEVAEAIANEDPDSLREELGDLLLQVVFHAQMAKERGWFDYGQVAEGIAKKMIDRHPHVFGEKQIESADAQTHHWEALKEIERKEKGHRSILDDVPHAFPALLRAQKLQKRAARVGFDWPSVDEVYAKIDEELAEVREAKNARERAEEIGDLLFVCVNLARHYDVQAEEALRSANRKFQRRFQYIEQTVHAQGNIIENMDLDALEALWQEAKRKEKIV